MIEFSLVVGSCFSIRVYTKMIDISLWRAVIGCWMHLPIHLQSGQKRCSSLIPATGTLLAVILILLVIGYIERNPGPVLRSTTANKKGMNITLLTII